MASAKRCSKFKSTERLKKRRLQLSQQPPSSVPLRSYPTTSDGTPIPVELFTLIVSFIPHRGRGPLSLAMKYYPEDVPCQRHHILSKPVMWHEWVFHVDPIECAETKYLPMDVKHQLHKSLSFPGGHCTCLKCFDAFEHKVGCDCMYCFPVREDRHEEIAADLESQVANFFESEYDDRLTTLDWTHPSVHYEGCEDQWLNNDSCKCYEGKVEELRKGFEAAFNVFRDAGTMEEKRDLWSYICNMGLKEIMDFETMWRESLYC